MKQVKIRGKFVNFRPVSLNRLLGTLNIDPHVIKDLILRPPYREIGHTLSGPNSVASPFLREQQIDEEVVDYRPWYDPKGLDVTKMKEPECIHGPVLSISERNARIDNVLSHLYGMQMLQ
ncbi:hypothetical protein HAX54_025411, partial [Datura stramonium]|nr:hypothetical protein [Datura stramonium]